MPYLCSMQAEISLEYFICGPHFKDEDTNLLANFPLSFLSNCAYKKSAPYFLKSACFFLTVSYLIYNFLEISASVVFLLFSCCSCWMPYRSKASINWQILSIPITRAFLSSTCSLLQPGGEPTGSISYVLDLWSLLFGSALSSLKSKDYEKSQKNLRDSSLKSSFSQLFEEEKLCSDDLLISSINMRSILIIGIIVIN